MLQPTCRISDAERQFLLDGISQERRNDGRGCYDYRGIVFEMEPLSLANTSCRFRAGETEILVAVKSDVGKLGPDKDAGSFRINVECAASVSRTLADGVSAEDWGKQLSVLLESLCGGNDVIDRQDLVIVPHMYAWDVYVDVLVLASGGNVLDSISLALCAVLTEPALLPRIDAEDVVEEGERTDLKVDSLPESGTPLKLKKVPLCVTAAQIADKILFDVTAEEELCADAMLCVVVDARSGDIMGISKLGRGLYDLHTMPDMMSRCRAAAASLTEHLERELGRELIKPAAAA